MSRTTTNRYAKCIEVSKRIRWDIDRDVIRGREFDFAQQVPARRPVAGRRAATSSTAAEQRLLSQIQGRTYANMFGLVERFIGAKMLEVSRDHWLGDQIALEALVRFTDEELKHQELFRRIEAMIAAGMPAGLPLPAAAQRRRRRGARQVHLGGARRSPATSSSSRRRTTARASSRTPTSPSCGRTCSCFHWQEESQHAILDELEWRREDAKLDAERSATRPWTT